MRVFCCKDCCGITVLGIISACPLSCAPLFSRALWHLNAIYRRDRFGDGLNRRLLPRHAQDGYWWRSDRSGWLSLCPCSKLHQGFVEGFKEWYASTLYPNDVHTDEISFLNRLENG